MAMGFPPRRMHPLAAFLAGLMQSYQGSREQSRRQKIEEAERAERQALQRERQETLRRTEARQAASDQASSVERIAGLYENPFAALALGADLRGGRARLGEEARPGFQYQPAGGGPVPP